MLLGIVKDVRAEQPWNAYLLRVVRLLGKETEANELQFRNAPSLMTITLLGISMEVRPEA